MLEVTGISFNRGISRTRELPLTPLIDVVFILIVFFMLTTSFMKIESMEMLLPSATSATPQPLPPIKTASIIIKNNGEIVLDQRVITPATLKNSLQKLFVRDPNQRVILYLADRVPLQRMVDVMDMVYLTGGGSVLVKEWASLAKHAPMQPVQLIP